MLIFKAIIVVLNNEKDFDDLLPPRCSLIPVRVNFCSKGILDKDDDDGGGGGGHDNSGGGGGSSGGHDDFGGGEGGKGSYTREEERHGVAVKVFAFAALLTKPMKMEILDNNK